MTMALEGGEVSGSRPGRSLPPGKDLVPIVQEAVVSEKLSVKKIKRK